MAESIEHYARTVEQILTEQRVLRHLQQELRKPVPVVRKAIKAAALALLPKSGGLNKWVAAIQVKVKQTVAGKTIRINFKGGRNSRNQRSDIDAIDRGRVRAPSWGRRTSAAWHTQRVTPGFFTDTAGDETPWVSAADTALDTALEDIR